MQPETAPRSPIFLTSRRRSLLVAGLCVVASATTFRGTPDAIAQGETRTLTFVHNHTKETATVTFRRWGSYDYSALEQLNWLLRDWRRDAKTRMNPKLFDVIWEAQRQAGSSSAVYVNSAYRSPETNAMLRRRSRAVSKHSQHMNGNAMDFYFGDISMARVREVAMQMQRGGVGYYANAGTPFVHLDVGSVRSWPRMSRDQLARLFPDEATVHLPAGGGTMANYESARATIIARGGTVGGYSGDEEMEGWSGGSGFFAALFGGGGRGRGGASAPVTTGDDAGVRAFAMNNGRTGPSEIASAAPATLRGRRGARNAPTAVAAASPATSPFLSPTSSDSSPLAIARGSASAPASAPPAQPAVQVPASTTVASAPIQIPNIFAALAPRQAEPAAKPAPTPTVASLPMPPRRPAEFSRVALASLGAAPLPPLRPTSPVAEPAGAPETVAGIRRTVSEPTTRPTPPPVASQVVAYAPVETPAPRAPLRPGMAGAAPIAASANAIPAVSPPPKTPALAGGVPTSRTRTLPAPVAARVAMAPVDAILMEFRRKADVGPSAGVFSGAAVKPVATTTAFRR